jgi:hypothetical protein
MLRARLRDIGVLYPEETRNIFARLQISYRVHCRLYSIAIHVSVLRAKLPKLEDY